MRGAAPVLGVALITALAPLSARARTRLAVGGESVSASTRSEQTFHGLPVLGRGVVTGAGLRVVDLEARLPSSARPVVSRADAVAAAQPFTRVPLTEEDARLVVHTGPRGGLLAYLVTPAVGRALPTAPLIAIDATTGRVLEARDRLRRANAFTYRENPVRTPEPELLPLPADVTGPGLSSPALVARSCVDRGGTRAVAIGGVTRAIRVCALEQVAVADAEGDFVFSPRSAPDPARGQADPFAETSLFWHAARIHERFRALASGLAPSFGEPPLDLVAGLALPPGISEGDLDAASSPDAELAPFAGAFYLPGVGEGETFRALYGATRGAVWFGRGTKVDFAYDGDVVAHEVTHALVHATLAVGGYRWTAEGVTAEPEAVDEALADYFAAALSGDPRIGEHVATESPQVAAAARSLEQIATCGGDMVGAPHDDSVILSGALWATRSALPEARRAAFDAAVLGALHLSPGRRDLGFEELAALIRQSVAADGEIAGAAPSLDAELTRRGVLPRCVPVRTLVRDVPLQAARHPFVAPGTDAVGNEAIAPGVVQLRLEVPDGAAAITLSFRASGVGASPLFGRAGASFRPVVLASWDRPIAWTRDAAGIARPDAPARVLPEGGARLAAEIDVPAGAKVAYLQIANEGQAGGVYDGLLAEVAAAGAADAGAAVVDAGEDEGEILAAVGSGCGCHVVGEEARVAPMFGAACAAALAARRRRRGR